MLNAVVQIPEAVQTDIADAAISQDSQIAVSGGARSSDGKVITFIAWLDASGLARMLIRTSPYTARRLCFAPDGSLWALGYERDETGMEMAGYLALRQYNREGAMIKAVLPPSVFPAGHGAVSLADLAVSAAGIGVYSPRSNEFLRISPKDGKVIERLPGPSLEEHEHARSIALTDNSNIYFTYRRVGGGVSVQRSLMNVEGWTAVTTLQSPIVGVDGSSLVISTGSSRFSWVAVD